ncbi:exonuclease SbcC [Salmonella bongori]|nr:exonuclease SbcC [Salmonella bongori]
MSAYHCKASYTPYSSKASQEQQRALEATAHFDAALTKSPFDNQAAFLAALLDEETIARLEKQQQALESQLQQAKALSAQSAQALALHQQHPPAGLDPTVPRSISR